ncbi:hypothetical protein X739_22270 [Mesorhizobium sp. LNHC220B00]|nr:hypothetical protein X739_22270 [Mesorhizobium sp. LNHC220B00]
MSTFRPADGFTITWTETVKALVAAEVACNPDFAHYWDDLIIRLKFTAHTDGWSDDRLGKGCRMFVSEAIPGTTRPRMVIIYRALGDQVRIRLLRIS